MKMIKVTMSQVLALVLSITFSATMVKASILVVAPHPDDDIVMAAGIVSKAVQRGEDVRIVYMTNGDYYGIQHGYTRQIEAVSGQNYLGVPENHLIFLGYPDGYLSTLYNNYSSAADRFVTPNGISSTYGTRGLGGMDYHSYRFGMPAYYNSANIITDLSHIISNFRPNHIFVPCQFDSHQDHVATYQLVRRSATAACNNNPGYEPVIHKTIIWGNSTVDWPNQPDPAVLIAEFPDLQAATGLSWSERESFNVPLTMQVPNYVDNPKALALNAHIDDQKGVYGYIGRFLHKDEVFWPENVVGNNHPPIVNAGNDQIVMQGATVNLNGSQSRDPDGTELAYHWVQRTGTPVQLSDSASATPSFTAPKGLVNEETLAFDLVVSDGHFITIPDSVSVKVLVSLDTSSNIAPSATATASSENSQYGQTAAKAVDGVVDGYPDDGTREWSTNGEKAGAWIGLSWNIPYIVNRIVVHDRINLSDNIERATIAFSDGSSMEVGPLNHNGTSTVYSFPSKTVTNMTITASAVSSSTYETGLAEIEVYGSPADSTLYSLSTNTSPSAGGTVSANPDQTGYFTGTQVILTASPNTGYVFSGWSGDVTGTANPLTVTIKQNTSLTAIFTAIPGTLSVDPATALSSSGAPGGPFSPSGTTYTLRNPGNTVINWNASATQPWVTISPGNGNLAPGETTSVVVSINSNAAALSAGTYSDTVMFTNTSNGAGSATRGVNLDIAAQSANIASLATVTASSENPQYGQTALKAVDGVIDGYPGDYTREWASAGESVGAWLDLGWALPYSVHQVILYDRPNSADNITNATIAFSDGTSIEVGPLNNDGTATTFTFPARVVTGMRVTVSGVSGSTQNAGLSEIEIYGNLADTTMYGISTNASPSVGGQVTANPVQAGYYSGTQVTLTATPNTGYAFSGWSGDASGSVNPLTVAITGNMTVTANFSAIPGTLSVTPNTVISVSGTPGGPFSPSGMTYTLHNPGSTVISWNASFTQPWITLSQSGGSLAPGETASVAVFISSYAASLPVGAYSDSVIFTNTTNGTGNTTRDINLSISVQPANIASAAVVTASSESPLYGQTALKTVDGVIDGYGGNPGDYTREWATNGEGVGAWLDLEWALPYSVNQLVLYDRPNIDDNIASATITFSDGTSVAVGPLNNDGTATTLTFPERVISGLRVAVTGVSGSTRNVGLSEIAVYGY